MVPSKKPLVLICVTPIFGHFSPLKAIGKNLVSRGYDVTFVTGSAYLKHCEEIGASLVPIEGYGDFTEADIPTRWPIRATLPPGPAQLAYDMENCFINSIPSQYEALRRALKLLGEKHPGHPIIQLTELAFFASIIGKSGAPAPQPTASLGIGIIPIVCSSIDTAPPGLGLPPDSSPEGRIRNKAMTEQLQGEMLGHVQKRFQEILNEIVGKEVPTEFWLDAAYRTPDRFLQMCIPSVEYPRSDAPPNLTFAGGLPKGGRDIFDNPPAWWSEITNSTTKKIVAISQGSLALNFADLVIPAITSLASRDDLLVVVALGRKGATLPADFKIPANCRVADYIPFDDLLPHSSVFITNGGYGAFQHAISNGTPLIIAGASEDKPEVAMRAEWSGVGINLRTGNPTPEALLTSVSEILTNPKYKKRAVELEAEKATYDPMEIIARNIEELAAGAHKA